MKAIGLLCVGSIILFLSSVCECGRHEDRLINDIFTTRSYNPYARPVDNEKEALEVKFGLALQQIIEVDEKQEMLHTNMWLNYEWLDYKLMWNSSEYGNVKSIRLPSKTIWTPDILMYNSADEDIDSMFPTNIVVTSDGKCSWIPLGLYISTCTIDIKYYPFDDQRCEMKFGSWSYDGTKINLTARDTTINLDTYSASGEWELLDAPATRNVRYYDCCPEPYFDITFAIHIKRRTLYHGINLIIPCALISMLALFTFALPPDTNAKVSLGITILLALIVFQLMVAEMVPSTSLAVPLIGVYSSCLMTMCTISLIITIVVISFHYRKPEMSKMSPFIEKYVCGWLAWFLRMSRPGHAKNLTDLFAKLPTADPNSDHPVVSVVSNKYDEERELTESQAPQERTKRRSTNGIMAYPLQQIRLLTGWPTEPIATINRKQLLTEEAKQTPLTKTRSELLAILSELEYITKSMKDEDEGSDALNEWKFAAMVIDRLCLWVFTIYLVVATFAIFFASPNLQEAVVQQMTGAGSKEEQLLG